MTIEEFSNIVSTLIINGFHIHHVDRISPNTPIIHTYKYDKLGAKIRYSILFSEDSNQTAVLQTLEKSANSFDAMPIMVNDNLKTDKLSSYTKEKFFDFFGGIVNTGLILIRNLPQILDELGHNKLPTGLTGEPEDLLELYASECLQYIFESPTRRYGSDRLFEKLPDGIVLCKGRFMILFDAKAYKNGFNFDSKTINSLRGYVDEFTQKYSSYFGSIFSVIVVSGHFNDSQKALEGRADELYKLCNSKISTIQGTELGNIVQFLKNNPDVRGSINWKNVFANSIVKVKYVQKEIDKIHKDKLH
jgi:hypothetical protein